jgi:hypothetical protein
VQLRLAILSLVAACSSPTSPVHISVNTTISVSEIRAGEPVVVTVVARNAGEKAARINVSPCTPSFVVTTQDGAVVGPAEHFCNLSLATRDLAPGESFTFVGQWTGDARSGEIKLPPSMLNPGTYTLRGRVISVDVGIIESEAVTIRIVPSWQTRNSVSAARAP